MINKKPAVVKLPTAKTFTRSDTDLNRILTSWSSNAADAPDFLCHFLDHKYTEDGLRMSRLVGADQAIANQVLQAANHSDVKLFLATFEHMRSGSCADYWAKSDTDAGIDEEFDSYSRLEKVVDLEGNAVAKNVVVDDDQMVQAVQFCEEVPDGEAFQGYTGNEGAEKTLWYRRAVRYARTTHRIQSD
jgi:hypothetical protein